MAVKKTAVKYKIKKNDSVQIISGKDKGKSGRVLRVDTAKGRVVVEGLNMVKKAIRPKGQNQKGGITSVEAPLAISKVMIVCKKCGPTRIGYRLENEQKLRVCRKCGEQLS
jgi:large subunit ribosomal protein L24